MCLHLYITWMQCQNLKPLNPVLAHHPFTSTPPALCCPTLRPRLLAMASAPLQVANRRLRLPSSSASCPLPVLATHPERCPHASANRSTSSYWREASHCLLEPSLPPPSPPPPALILLPQRPALPQTLPHQLWENSTQVCFTHPQMPRTKSLCRDCFILAAVIFYKIGISGTFVESHKTDYFNF